MIDLTAMPASPTLLPTPLATCGLTRERVVALCARLGITAARPLTPRELNNFRTAKASLSAYLERSSGGNA